MTKILRVLLFTLGVACLSSSSVAEALNSSREVRPEFFGWVIQRAHTKTPWPNVQFGTWRLWDSYLKWSDVEPEPGVYKFDAFDTQIALAAEHGVEPFYTFGQTPRWASRSPDEKHAWGMGAGAMPKDIADWKRYVETIISRYKGRIRTYEVWNEPKYRDLLGKCPGAIFFCGTAEELVALTKVASEAIRRLDPTARLATPGFTDGLHGVKRLDDYLGAGGAKYVDLISFHFYSLEPEEAIGVYRALIQVMKKHGLEKLAVWDTEHGYLIQNQDNKVVAAYNIGPNSVVFSPDDASVMLARVHIIEASLGIERIVWYSWDNARMGVLGVLDNRPSVMADAYAVLRRWLIGSMVSCNDRAESGIMICSLGRAGRQANIYWSVSGSSAAQLNIAGPGKRMVERLLGESIPMNAPQNFEIGKQLILVANDGKPW